MTHYVGDIPSRAVVIQPAPDTVELDDFDTAAATIVDPSGDEIDDAGLVAAIDDELGAVTIAWPDTSLFTEAGLYQLRVTLTDSETDARQKLPPFAVIVQSEDDGWANLDTAREETRWPDANTLSDRVLFDILIEARRAVIAYADEVGVDFDEDQPASNLRFAQIMQARNIHNAIRVDPSTGDLGDGSFQVRAFPLDWQVQQIIKPKSRRPRFGTFPSSEAS
jgi:hypothetical protein